MKSLYQNLDFSFTVENIPVHVLTSLCAAGSPMFLFTVTEPAAMSFTILSPEKGRSA